MRHVESVWTACWRCEETETCAYVTNSHVGYRKGHGPHSGSRHFPWLRGWTEEDNLNKQNTQPKEKHNIFFSVTKNMWNMNVNLPAGLEWFFWHFVCHWIFRQFGPSAAGMTHKVLKTDIQVRNHIKCMSKDFCKHYKLELFVSCIHTFAENNPWDKTDPDDLNHSIRQRHQLNQLHQIKVAQSLSGRSTQRFKKVAQDETRHMHSSFFHRSKILVIV